MAVEPSMFTDVGHVLVRLCGMKSTHIYGASLYQMLKFCTGSTRDMHDWHGVNNSWR